MVEEVLTVKTTVEGEEKESALTVSVPESLSEASKEWGKEETFTLAARMFRLDKTNAERVALRGGEAKLARKEANDLAKQLLSNPELLAKIKAELG